MDGNEGNEVLRGWFIRLFYGKRRPGNSFISLLMLFLDLCHVFLEKRSEFPDSSFSPSLCSSKNDYFLSIDCSAVCVSLFTSQTGLVVVVIPLVGSVLCFVFSFFPVIIEHVFKCIVVLFL